MKFFVQKLGCPKNDVDADYISARLVADGHEPAKSPEEADSLIVNTCGFIQAAKEESINAILDMGQLKKKSGGPTLYATGCLTQRYGDELLADIPELDSAFGHGALDSIAGAVGSASRDRKTIRIEPRKLGYLSWRDRFIADQLPYSYLKISDGCDRGCTYCAIPGMRGKFRSRPLESIVREAKFLAENGKKELILVSQEATLWGYGVPGDLGIIDLLKALELVDGVEWIRLMYLYPAEVSDELIAYMAADNKTLDYFDLPLQHVNTELLEGMQRRIDGPTIDQLIKRIRTGAPGATVRTTFIVGFPGETEEQFAELEAAVERYEFERMGVFTYSPEEGTPAAEMAGQIADEIKADRMDRLMCAQRDIALARNNSLIGRTLPVIIDSVDDNARALGRSRADCPDIDQEVYVEDNTLKVGDMCQVRIESVDGYDLIGRPVTE